MPETMVRVGGCTKIFVVDTSVLLHDPDAIYFLAKDPSNLVVVPLCIIDELGDKRSAPSEIGFNAMSVIRIIDGLRKNGEPSLHNGVQIGPGKGYVIVDHDGVGVKSISRDLRESSENRILVIARNWQKARRDARVVLVTKNIGLRLKADAVGILAEDYKNDKVAGNQPYSGVVRITVAIAEMDTITPLCSRGEIPAKMLSQSVDPQSLFPNQCLVLSYGEKTALAVYKQKEGVFRSVPKSQKSQRQNGRIAGIKPINVEQEFLYWLLRDSSISCVMVTGKAGTGKSLVSFFAGYEQFIKEAYERFLIFKPVIEVGEQTLGFLPGDLQEKMEPWKAAIFDSLRLIIEEESGPSAKERVTARGIVEDFMQRGLMEIGPISFIRGRTFSNAFIVVDEAQNLTPREVKALITRVGKGSKIVLLGDTEQIDNPFLDGLSNGLVRAVHSLMGSELTAHIELVRGERSELAELAASIM